MLDLTQNNARASDNLFLRGAFFFSKNWSGVVHVRHVLGYYARLKTVCVIFKRVKGVTFTLSGGRPSQAGWSVVRDPAAGQWALPRGTAACGCSGDGLSCCCGCARSGRSRQRMARLTER